MTDQARKRLGFLWGEKGVGPGHKLAHSVPNSRVIGEVFFVIFLIINHILYHYNTIRYSIMFKNIYKKH